MSLLPTRVLPPANIFQGDYDRKAVDTTQNLTLHRSNHQVEFVDGQIDFVYQNVVGLPVLLVVGRGLVQLGGTEQVAHGEPVVGL